MQSEFKYVITRLYGVEYWCPQPRVAGVKFAFEWTDKFSEAFYFLDYATAMAMNEIVRIASGSECEVKLMKNPNHIEQLFMNDGKDA